MSLTLVGRVEELATLLASCNAARGGFVLVTGEAGSGKTRLLAEVGVRTR